MSVTINVTEFSGIGRNDGRIPVPIASGFVTSYSVTGTTNTRSSAFGAGTTIIRIKGDPAAACYIASGSSAPTATVASMKLSIDETEWLAVEPGQGWKIAVYDGSS